MTWGSTGSAMRSALLPLSWLYAGVMAVRNLAFDLGFLRVTRLTVPVIAVGNLTAGGTGKTPLVEWIVRRLLERGRKVGVVSRGYGRRSSGVVIVSDGARVLADPGEGGDEPVQIARKFPAARVVVGERRAEAAEIARKTLHADVLVLDDAYQHRSLHRDLNILVLEAGKDLRKEPILPAGLRRESLRGLDRADVLAVSGLPPGKSLRDIQPTPGWGSGPVIGYRYAPGGFRRAEVGERRAPGAMTGKRAFVFSAIGRHERFVASISAQGVSVCGDLGFKDHHWFAPEDCEWILRRFRENHAEILVTTEKDAVRMTADRDLRENFLRPFPVWIAELEVDLAEGEERLLALIDRTLRNSE
jgi:tetraacyldisaccharide 4'-kinase